MKKTMKKHISFITLAFALVNYQFVQAQELEPCDCEIQNKQEIGISLKAGAIKSYGTLPSPFETEISTSAALGVQYDYFFKSQWSVGIGAQFAMQSFDFGAKNLNDEREYFDTENDHFIFSYTADQYQEKWKMSQVNIPITIQYIGKSKTSIYAKTGVQYSLLMSSKATQTWKNLDTKGYFPFYDISLDAPLYAGYGFQSRVENTPELELKNRLGWIAEVGVRHTLKNEHVLYIGVYADIGINNQKTTNKRYKEDILTFKSELGNAIEYNSIQQLSEVILKDYSAGIQLRYSIGL